MFDRLLPHLFLSACIIGSMSSARGQSQPGSITALPPPTDMQAAIASLKTTAAPTTTTFQDLVVAPDSPSGNSVATSTNTDNKTRIPAASLSSVIIQFKPGLSAKDVNSYVDSHKLQVINKFPISGSIEVSADIGKYFTPSITDHSANDALFRGIESVNKDYIKDNRILSATPNTVFRAQSFADSGAIVNMDSPSSIISAMPTSVTASDWGVKDIQASQLWTMPGATDGVIFGILDIGFSRHSDLTFLEFPSKTTAADHGNHVAGIACGHPSADGVGARGVLPNCYIRARSTNTKALGTGQQITEILFIQSQIMSQLEDFVGASDDVSTFSVSLGYNWLANMTGVDTGDSSSKAIQNIIAIQGRVIQSYLEQAATRGKLIFFAAGNDSQGLDKPVQAQFASPFDWAVRAAEAEGITGGVIVEAHDKDGKLASFSNVGGDISCPGVNVFSTVAFDANHAPSISAYGTMSGTSMATPYCAAGYSLFRLTRPNYTAQAALACLLQSPAKSSSGTPMLRLKDAVDRCK